MTRDDFQSSDTFLLWQVLDRIATALETPPAEPPSQTPPEMPACLHPPESRIDLGLTNGQPDWQCRVCRFRPDL